MKSMLITPKNQAEFNFVAELLKKLNISSATMTEEELEDIGLSKMLHASDKTRTVSKDSILKKLNS